MPQEEFWHGEPRLAAAYRRAEAARRDNRLREEWRAGAYVHAAICAALSKGGEYPPEPIFAAGGGDPGRRERAEMERMLARFEAAAAGVNRKLAADGGPGKGR